MIPRTYLPRWLAVFALAPALAAQGRDGEAPVVLRGGLVIEQEAEAPQTGAAVRMFESPTLDRFLRKAQDFLGRGDHTGAIKVLQDVLDGNIRPDGAAPLPTEGTEGTESAQGAGETPAHGPLVDEDDPTHAVFSGDQRLYRPVRRLCHELLAALPDDGLALYREMYEIEAERAHRSGAARRDVRELEHAYNRFFATLHAGRALSDAGDLMMHAGRYRAAIQTFRILLEVYPAQNRALVPGLSEPYIELKIALCFAAMGESQRARELLDGMQQRYPEAALRVAGELVPVAELAAQPVFARGDEGRVVEAPRETPAVLRSLDDGLVPVWQYQYSDPEPYRSPAGNNNRQFVVGETNGAAAPWYNRHVPGSTVQFDAGRLVFMDHFRLRVHDLGSGLVQMQTGESDRPADPGQGKARTRIPVYDWASLRVVWDPSRYYCVVGHESRANLALEPILRNHLAAYERATLRQSWTTEEWKLEGKSYAGVTFLATPTVFGKRLLVPTLVQGAYALQGIEASSGEPLFRVHLHAGGTDLARAPAVPVQVSAGTAYVLTNAGTVAAVDAFTGELHWIRRYERTHPFRPSAQAARRSRVNAHAAMQQVFRHVSLPGFVPSEVIAFEGRVLVAPSDGEAMLCLDGASGEVLWMISKPGGPNVHVLGHNSRYLYLGGASVMCVDLRSGVRLWSAEVPETAWTGRGLVTEESVVVPGTRALYSLPADGQGEWRRTQLPAFSIGAEPQPPPCNLYLHGPYLVACHEGGIEVFASLVALHELAQVAADPLERADLLVQAGDLMAAADVLGPLCLDEARPVAERKKIGRRTLALVRDVALARASHAARDDALALLERTKPWFWSRDLELQWQLVRIELFQTLRELDAVDREQDVLTQMMEGKR